MNDLQKAYLDGASMAYRDVAEKLRTMISKAPPEIAELLKAMTPFADSCALKADGIYKEAELLEGIRQ